MIFKKNKTLDKIYKLLSSTTENICQAIKRYYDTEAVFGERLHISLISIFVHLCYFVRNYYLVHYNTKKADNACRYLAYQLALRIDNLDEFILAHLSDIITDLAGYQKTHDGYFDDCSNADELKHFLGKDIYEDASKSIIKNVCFYDTYFYKYNTDMVEEIRMILKNLDNSIGLIL